MSREETGAADKGVRPRVLVRGHMTGSTWYPEIALASLGQLCEKVSD